MTTLLDHSSNATVGSLPRTAWTGRFVNMQKTSYNVLFVYALLIVDLVINVSDKLLYPPQTTEDISKSAFSVVLLQICAILVVVIELVLHFFYISDQVRQFAWFQYTKSSTSPRAPMPQRIALKLVLDKYWWSLVVGILYLVLTIILQLIRLDPRWHVRTLDPSTEGNSMNVYNNFIPIIVVLAHKLMSTCYYVSFVVIYRATPNQMINRIFSNKPS